MPYGSGLDLDRSPYRSADASLQRLVSRWPWQDGPVVADAALLIEQLALAGCALLLVGIRVLRWGLAMGGD
jgi:hypothetical protein